MRLFIDIDGIIARPDEIAIARLCNDEAFPFRAQTIFALGALLLSLLIYFSPTQS